MKVKTLIFISFLFLFFSACKKHSSCFDRSLYNQHKNSGCTADCPGVTGCDGKTYCNECEANRQGIKVQH